MWASLPTYFLNAWIKSSRKSWGILFRYKIKIGFEHKTSICFFKYLFILIIEHASLMFSEILSIHILEFFFGWTHEFLWNRLFNMIVFKITGTFSTYSMSKETELNIYKSNNANIFKNLNKIQAEQYLANF